MVTISVIISGILEIVIPVLLAVFFVRRYRGSWQVVGVGVLTFLVSQLVHLPLLGVIGKGLNAAGISFPPQPWGSIISGIYLGLMAGLCEEWSRYFGFKLLKTRAEPFKAGLLAGTGHGGVESVLLGVSLLANYFIMLSVSKSGAVIPGLTPEIIEATLTMPFYMPLLGLLERTGAIILHLILSVLVWKAVSARKWGWLWLAIAYHALVDGLVVMAAGLGMNIVLIEALFMMVTVLNVILLIRLRKKWEEPIIEG